MNKQNLESKRTIKITSYALASVNEKLTQDARKAVKFIDTLVEKGIPLEQVNTTDWAHAPIKVFVTIPYGRKGGGKSKDFKRFSSKEVDSALKYWNASEPDEMKNGGKAQHKFGKVMKEFSEGKLKSSSGDKVTDRKQAVAIAFSEAREVYPQFGQRNKRKNGGKDSKLTFDYFVVQFPQYGETKHAKVYTDTEKNAKSIIHFGRGIPEKDIKIISKEKAEGAYTKGLVAMMNNEGGKESQYDAAVRTLGIEVNPAYKYLNTAKDVLEEVSNMKPSLAKDFKVKLIVNAVDGNKEKFYDAIRNHVDNHAKEISFKQFANKIDIETGADVFNSQDEIYNRLGEMFQFKKSNRNNGGKGHGSIETGAAEGEKLYRVSYKGTQNENLSGYVYGRDKEDAEKNADKEYSDVTDVVLANKQEAERFEQVRTGSVGKSIATVLVISSKHPLSTQLQELTGDSWNDIDFETLEKQYNFFVIKNRKSGKIFVVFKATYIIQVDKYVIDDDLSYIKQRHNLSGFHWTRKPEGFKNGGKDDEIYEVVYRVHPVKVLTRQTDIVLFEAKGTSDNPTPAKQSAIAFAKEESKKKEYADGLRVIMDGWMHTASADKGEITYEHTGKFNNGGKPSTSMTDVDRLKLADLKRISHDYFNNDRPYELIVKTINNPHAITRKEALQVGRFTEILQAYAHKRGEENLVAGIADFKEELLLDEKFKNGGKPFMYHNGGKPSVLINRLSTELSKKLEDFNVKEIFIDPYGELAITSEYDLDPSFVEAIEKEVMTPLNRLEAFVFYDEKLSGEAQNIYADAEKNQWDADRLHKQFMRIFSYMAEVAYNKQHPETPIELTEEERHQFANEYAKCGCEMNDATDAKTKLENATAELEQEEEEANWEVRFINPENGHHTGIIVEKINNEEDAIADAKRQLSEDPNKRDIKWEFEEANKLPAHALGDYKDGGKGKSKKYVAVSEKGDYWIVISKPSSKEDAQYQIDLGVPRGEVGKVVTLEEALAHKNILGEEYLKMHNGGKIEDVSTPEEFKKWAAKRNVELIDELNGFRVGDTVTYTNEFGVSFAPRTIIGIRKDDSFNNRRFHLAKDAYWFPVKPEEIAMYKKEMKDGGRLSEIREYVIKNYPDKDLNDEQFIGLIHSVFPTSIENKKIKDEEIIELMKSTKNKMKDGGIPDNKRPEGFNRLMPFELNTAIYKDKIYKFNKEDGIWYLVKQEIPNNYKGKIHEQVWDEWTPEQRTHFINDHFKGHHYLDSLRKYVNNDWNDFPDIPIKGALDHEMLNHVLEGQYKDGGKGTIKNQYAGKTPEQVWKEWNLKQKKHFILDHSDVIYPIAGNPLPDDLAKMPHQTLPGDMKEIIRQHIAEGQYKDGGKPSDYPVGTIYKLKNGSIYTVISHRTVTDTSYSYPSDEKGNPEKGGRIISSNSWLGETPTVIGKTELKSTSRNIGGKTYTYYLSGDREIDVEMSGLDDRWRAFAEHAGKKLRAKYDEQEDMNAHYANSKMVNDWFNDHKRDGGKGESKSVLNKFGNYSSPSGRKYILNPGIELKLKGDYGNEGLYEVILWGEPKEVIIPYKNISSGEIKPIKMTPEKKALAAKASKLEKALEGGKLSEKSRKSMESQLNAISAKLNKRPSVYERMIDSKGKFYIEMPDKYRGIMVMSTIGMKPRFVQLADKIRIFVDSKAKLNRLYEIYSEKLRKESLPVPPLEQISGKPSKVKKQK